jgi:lipopolysaccharide biosynthesis regulator YciM
MTTLEQLEEIYKEAEDLEQKVNVFTGSKQDHEYRYMEEMLTRLIIKLDNIDSAGKDEIRRVRRKAVKTVQATLDHLELKALAHERTQSSYGQPNSQPERNPTPGSNINC